MGRSLQNIFILFFYFLILFFFYSEGVEKGKNKIFMCRKKGSEELERVCNLDGFTYPFKNKS